MIARLREIELNWTADKFYRLIAFMDLTMFDRRIKDWVKWMIDECRFSSNFLRGRLDTYIRTHEIMDSWDIWKSFALLDSLNFQWERNDEPHQQFKLVHVSGNTYNIISEKDGKALDVAGYGLRTLH